MQQAVLTEAESIPQCRRKMSSEQSSPHPHATSEKFCQYVTFCLLSNHLPSSQIICLSIHQLLWTFKPPVHRHKGCLDPSCPLLWQCNNEARELPAGYQPWRNTAQPEGKEMSAEHTYTGRKLESGNSAKSHPFSCECHKRKMLRIITTIAMLKC